MNAIKSACLAALPILRILFLSVVVYFVVLSLSLNTYEKMSEPSHLPWSFPLLGLPCAILMHWQSLGLIASRQEMRAIRLDTPKSTC